MTAVTGAQQPVSGASMPHERIDPAVVDVAWRREKATRASLVVDAGAYFEAAREAMLKARRRIMLLGWDFDARIELTGEARRLPGEPGSLGEFVLWLVHKNPALEVYLLRWNIGALRTMFRGNTAFTLLRWMAHPRIHTRLDSASPAGASQHHKIVTVDDCTAFCGGIDMTSNRWDSRAHLDDEPRRVSPGGTPYGAWHDTIMAVEGPVASALAELARERWRAAGGEALEPVRGTYDCWPQSLAPQFRDVAVGISRTRPGTAKGTDRDGPAVYEIEQLFLGAIRQARRSIYAESQYFASRRIAEAIAERLTEADPPEIVIVNSQNAHGWLEPIAMDTARARLVQYVRRADHAGRLRLYHPVTAGGHPIYVHAKLLIVDDRIMHTGSANMNNRSLRLDTECDLTIDARSPGNSAAAAAIVALRDDLLAEHLGVTPAEVAAVIAREGTLIAAIEALRGDGRSLRELTLRPLSEVEKWLADNELLDPEGPEEMFKPLSQRRNLVRRLRRLVRLRERLRLRGRRFRLPRRRRRSAGKSRPPPTELPVE